MSSSQDSPRKSRSACVVPLLGLSRLRNRFGGLRFTWHLWPDAAPPTRKWCPSSVEPWRCSLVRCASLPAGTWPFSTATTVRSGSVSAICNSELEARSATAMCRSSESGHGVRFFATGPCWVWTPSWTWRSTSSTTPWPSVSPGPIGPFSRPPPRLTSCSDVPPHRRANAESNGPRCCCWRGRRRTNWPPRCNRGSTLVRSTSAEG